MHLLIVSTGDPHIGHAYTMIIADVLARHKRNNGSNVMFLTGTDEYGMKIEQTAHSQGKTPADLVEENSNKFRRLATAVNCSHDRFIRTTESSHRLAVQKLWLQLQQSGHIYLDTYKGWYSIRDETFYSQEELIDGKAPTGAPVEWVEEESYFFRLSAWTQSLLEHYQTHPDFVSPPGRMKELLALVTSKGQLDDVSISRTSFTWGIPVPPQPSGTSPKEHVVYVWLDALVNYISALHYGEDSSSPLMKQFWPADVQIIGKDILRFHAVLWPALLLAVGLPPPRMLLAHGWWTMDGQKMSKSVGNVIDPIALVDAYGSDYLRYFLLAETPTGSDGDFSMEAFARRINGDLCDVYGNLVQRVMSMAHKHCEQSIPIPTLPLLACDEELLAEAVAAAEMCTSQYLPRGDIHRMIASIMAVARSGNKYAEQQAPWKLRKTDTARMHTTLYVLIELIRRLAIMLEPIIPDSTKDVFTQLNITTQGLSMSSLSDRLEGGQPIPKPTPIFKKIDTENLLMTK